jgi:hypothetical protein
MLLYNDILKNFEYLLTMILIFKDKIVRNYSNFLFVLIFLFLMTLYNLNKQKNNVNIFTLNYVFIF